jgi:asparagine synthase (glutamine-hydrolysing)
MAETVERHAPAGRPYSALLSGGLDSRTLVGYLDRAGRDVTAFTLGRASDLELKCARTVARSLGMTQRLGEVATDRFKEYARIHAGWDHCAPGSSLLIDWGVVDHLAQIPNPCVSGLCLDWVLGGHAPTVPNLSFDHFFAYQNAWGLPPDALAALLRRDVFRDLVVATKARIEAVYRGYSDVEWRRAWSFSLYHRNRFHIGSDAWRFSFGAWPILPANDRRLLELGASLPPAAAADRRAQYELLRTRFPKLARLPLDRNSPDVTPLSLSLTWLLTEKVRSPLRRLRNKVKRQFGWMPEQRRYYRVFDINNEGWRAVRRLAEPYRDLGYQFFEREALDNLWPRPEANFSVTDGITDVAAIKTILGFLIWADDHLGS